MSQQEVIRLFRNANSNPGLKKQLNTAPTPEKFVEMARTEGYEFTVEEWQKATRFSVEELKCELSEIPGI
ncbi:MAG: Nif11-like leader peptide family natural product precursor [Mastigocoleus sp.]